MYPNTCVVPADQVSRYAFQQWTSLEIVADLLFLICKLNTRASKDVFSILLDTDTSDDFAKCDFFLCCFSSFITAVFKGLTS